MAWYTVGIGKQLKTVNIDEILMNPCKFIRSIMINTNQANNACCNCTRTGVICDCFFFTSTSQFAKLTLYTPIQKQIM